jgi:hypothetical protein
VLFPRLSWKLDERRRAEPVRRPAGDPQRLGRRLAQRQPGRQLPNAGLRRDPAGYRRRARTMASLEVGWMAKLAGGKLD